MNPIEQRIRAPSDRDVYECARAAFPDRTDTEIIAELMRMIAIVAVCHTDVVEGGHDAAEVFDRYIFVECDDLANYFPWPDD